MERERFAGLGGVVGQRQVVMLLALVFFVLALACNLLIIVGSVPDFRAFWFGLLAAILPALLYAALILAFDRYEPEPWRNLLGAFGWGALIATLFSIFFGALADDILKAVWGDDLGGRLAVVVGRPVVEESFKGLALLLLLLIFRGEFDGILDGLVYGALIGLGFAMTENVIYLGQAFLNDGIQGLGRLFLAREVFGGLGHALYTGTIGAAVGWTRLRYGRGWLRLIVPVAGWALAVVQHSLWNGSLTAPTPLLALPQVVAIAAQTVAFITPGLVLLAAIAIRSLRAESRLLREHLAEEVARGTLTSEEYDILTHERRHQAELFSAFRTGGIRRWSLQQRFFQAAAELAFCKEHERQGEPQAPEIFGAPEDEFRARLSMLRAELAK
jgi:RsiW-degrading membrane proteinase PrsW (M82 family)